MSVKRFIKNAILYIVLMGCLISMVFSAYKIILWWKDNNQNKKIMSSIYEDVVIDKNNEDNVNISELQKNNSEAVGWIKVENTNIDYPIVQASDNEYYLTHSFDKSVNKAGWIYVDFRNKLDSTDKNIVIYGHNRRDGSMFGSLKEVLNEKWYTNEENMKIKLIIGDKAHEYKIFSAYQIEKEDYYLTTNFEDEKEYQKYINRAKTKSIRDFNEEVSTNDKILTLSTCANNNNYRVVVHAVRIDE